jgi:hypothetical protein
MNYILYQAYGNKDILNEAIFSILSFERLPSKPDVEFVIYTDDKEYFKNRVPENTHFELITKPQLTIWRGATDFVHRVKVEIIKDFFGKYKGNLLYIDTDTTFISDPSPIFEGIDEGKVYMHICEGKIDSGDNLVFKKLSKFLKGKSFILKNKETLSIREDIPMWNAGLLAFDTRTAILLDEVLEITDILHNSYQRHVMEQLAFSFVLQTKRNLLPADKWVFHYWNFKEIRPVLNDFLSSHQNLSFKELSKIGAKIDIKELFIPKGLFESLPRWKQKVRKIFKLKTWQMPEYKFW